MVGAALPRVEGALPQWAKMQRLTLQLALRLAGRPGSRGVVARPPSSEHPPLAKVVVDMCGLEWAGAQDHDGVWTGDGDGLVGGDSEETL